MERRVWLPSGIKHATTGAVKLFSKVINYTLFGSLMDEHRFGR